MWEHHIDRTLAWLLEAWEDADAALAEGDSQNCSAVTNMPQCSSRHSD